MDKSHIGIKLADGRFFPIFQQDHSGRQRLVLTTVADNQASVQIELYRGIGEEMREAQYIGTLVIQNVEEGPAGGPEISLVLGTDAEGNLNANAADEKSGEYESLSVRLEPESVDQAGDFELSDSSFDFDEDADLDAVDLSDESLEEDSAPATEPQTVADHDADELETPDYEGAGYPYEKSPPGFAANQAAHTEEPARLNTVNLLLFIAFIALSVAGLGLLTYIIFQALRGPDLPSLLGGVGVAVLEAVRTAVALL